MPARTSWLIRLMSTNPFSTATPDRAMNPTAADTENGIPRSHRASTPPVRASGTPVNTSNACRPECSAVNGCR